MKRAIRVVPVTPARWGDLVELFGERGAVAGCWCMWFRLTGSEFRRNAGVANRRALRSLVDRRPAPGLLAYVGGRPAGWVGVAPRTEFGRIERSPTLKRTDDTPVWSVVCFYIDRKHRRQGVGSALLQGAVDYAASKGARVVEGYPLDKERAPDLYAYYGLASMFRRAGFAEVARRSPTRPIMRLVVGSRAAGRSRAGAT